MHLWMKSSVLALLALIAVGSARAAVADETSVSVHETFTLESKGMGETRRMNVYVPPGFDAKAATRYPVLYLLDGGEKEDWPNVSATLDAAMRAGEMRRMIVVGIENTERRRDVTGPTEIEEDRKIAPRVGGSANFRRFIREELMPEVRRRYPVTDETAIMGESLAGLFVVETFFLEPEMFDTYLAFDPSLWWNREELVRKAGERLGAQANLRNTLYLTSSGVEEIAAAVARLAETLRAKAPAGLRWAYTPRPDLRHDNIYRTELPVALRTWLAPVPAPAAAAAADLVQIPGTKTSLQPPAGFLLADKFPGFERPELQASIMVTEMPAPAAEVMKAMTKEGLASRGMTLLASKSETLDGREALLLHVSQMAMGTDYLKWMLVTGDPKNTLIVVGSFPRSAEGQVGEAVRRSVLTTSWSPAGGGVSNPFEGLLFRVTPTPKLKLAGRVSNMLMLTESGKTGPLPPSEALYVVGNSHSDVRIEDLRVFSESRARKTEQLQGLQNLQGRAFEIDGLPAYEILADAKDVKTGAPMRLYQVIAAEKDGYFIFQGLVTPQREAEMLPEFQRVTETFRRSR